jgi:predicted nucleic acid-binding Zn ribbon protein
MRFDDIGEEPIYWCTFCGEQAKAMDKVIQAAFANRPEFAAEFEKAINDANENLHQGQFDG